MADAGTAVFTAIADFSRVRKESADTRDSLKKTRDESKQFGPDTEQSTKKAQGAWGTLASLATKHSKQLEQAGQKATLGFTLPVVGGAALAVNSFMKFDEQMNQSLAIMGKVSDGVRKKMGDTARDVAKQTVFSADELASAFYYLGSAGMNAEQSMAALPKVAAFAQAGMFDLENATTLLLDAQKSLGLSFEDPIQNMNAMVRVSDVLVKASVLSNASIEQLSKALTSNAAPAMRAMNVSLEDGVAVLALYADRGIKAENAGQKLYSILRDLPRAANQNYDAFEALGIQVFDQGGKLRDLGDIVGDFDTALAGMTDEQRAAALASLKMTEESLQAIQILRGGKDTIHQYQAALKAAGGTTQEIAEKQMQSFQNQLKKAKSEMMDAAMTIGERLIPMLSKLMGFLAGVANWFGNLPTGIQNTVLVLVALGATVGPLLLLVGKLVGAVTAIKGAMAAWQAASAASSVSMMGLLPGILGVVAAVGLLVWWMKSASDSNAEHEAKVKSLSDSLFDEKGALSENTDAWREYIEKQSEFSKNAGQIETLTRDLGLSMSDLQSMMSDTDGADRFMDALQRSGKFLDENAHKNEVNERAMKFWESLPHSEVLSFNGKLVYLDESTKKLIDSFGAERRALQDAAKAKTQVALASDSLTDAQKLQITQTYKLADANADWVGAAGDVSDALSQNEQQTVKEAAAVDVLTGKYDAAKRAAGPLGMETGILTQKQKDQAQAAEDLSKKIEDVLDAEIALFDKEIAWRKSISETKTAIEEYNRKITGTYMSQQDLQLATDEAASAVLAQGNAAVAAATQNAAAEGRALSWSEKQAILKSNLDAVAQTLAPGNPLRTQIEGYITRLDKTTGDYTARMKLDTSAANQALVEWNQLLAASGINPDDAQGAFRYRLANPNVQIGNPSTYPQGRESGGLLRMESGGIAGPGFVTGGPTFLVGEGNQAYPEYVVPTDPFHKKSAMALWNGLTRDLGIGLARGGLLQVTNPYAAPNVAPAEMAGTNVSFSFGDVYNPAPEPATDSAERAARKMRMLGVL